ncbi:MAG: ATP-binding cassette domain-containing protein [Acidilobaceae archaeon]
MSIVIEADRLTKYYGSIQAVKNVSFKVFKGEIYALLGPNGAGKTTTIKMLSTLLKPTSGDAYILGYSIIRDSLNVRKVIGVVPQDLTADDELTGFYNVYIQARLYGYPHGIALERAMRALEIVGLADSANRRVSSYSGGMRRRLEIAMSLVHDPEVLLLDEPTLGLDVQTRRLMWNLIRDFKKQGISMILTTHYMEEAEALADRVAIIDYGEIKAEGSPDELKRKVKGDRVYIELYSEDDAQNLQLEISKLGVDVKLDSSIVIVTAPSASDILPHIVGILAGKKIKSINIVKPNLEEVFLDITGKRLREDSFDAFKYRVFTHKIR